MFRAHSVKFEFLYYRCRRFTVGPSLGFDFKFSFKFSAVHNEIYKKNNWSSLIVGSVICLTYDDFLRGRADHGLEHWHAVARHVAHYAGHGQAAPSPSSHTSTTEPANKDLSDQVNNGYIQYSESKSGSITFEVRRFRIRNRKHRLSC